MKKFIISILCVAVFFMGIGSLIQSVGAKFKSDERALELVRRARIAIGGEESITNVKSFSIKGKQTVTLNLNGASTENVGDVEIALQLPNQMMKSMKFGQETEGGANAEIIEKDVRVVVMKDGNGNVVTENVSGPVSGKPMSIRIENAGGTEEKIIVKKADGTTEELTGIGDQQEITIPDGNKVIVRRVEGGNAAFVTKEDNGKPNIITEEIRGINVGQRQNELLRLTLSLLMSAPQGTDIAYTYGGEGNVDSNVCNIVNASFAGETFKIFLDKSTNLPVAMNYSGMQLPKNFTVKSSPKGEAKGLQIVTATAVGNGDLTNFQVKFSDYRNVSGVNLPHRWVTTSAGNPDETFEVSSIEVNPANIAEKFNKQPQRITMRVAKPQ